MTDGGNIVGTAAIKITADAQNFQSDLEAAVRQAIQAVEADLKVGLGLVGSATGKGASEGPSGADDAHVSSVTGIEERQAATSSAHNLTFNVSGVRAAIEEALKAPFIVRFEAQRVGNASEGEQAHRPVEAPTQSVASGSTGTVAQPPFTVPQGVVDVMKRNTTLTSQLVELHRNLTRAMTSAGKPVSDIDPEAGGQEAARVADLVRILGTNDARMWLTLSRNEQGKLIPSGPLASVMKDAGVPVETRRQVLESARPLFYGGGHNEDGSLRATGGSIYDTRDAQGKGSGNPSFAAAMGDATFAPSGAPEAVPAAQPIEPVRMAAPLADLETAAARIVASAPEAAEPDRAERHASRKAKEAARQSFAESVSSVRWGAGVASPGPYTGTYERPAGEEVVEEQRVLTDAEKADATRRRRRMGGIRTYGRTHPLNELQQQRLKEDQEWLDAHREGPTRTGVGPEVAGDRSGGRPVLAGEPTSGRDPGRSRSTGSPLPTEQQIADQLKAQQDLVQGGGGGRVRGPGISQRSKNQVNQYNDASLRRNIQGIDVDLAPFLREVQRGGQGPWFGAAAGGGGAFQIPVVGEGENPPYGEIIAREQAIKQLASSKKPFDLPGVPGITGKVAPVSRKEAILRMAQDQIGGGGDPATRDLIASFFQEPGTTAALNAGLAAKLPGPNAGFSGDTPVRSSNPQRQATLDLARAQQLHLRDLALGRQARAEERLNASEPGSQDQDKAVADARRAVADARRAANRAADLETQGAGPIPGTLADAQRMAAVDAAVGRQTRPMVERGENAQAFGEGKGRFGSAAGGDVPILQGRETRKELASWFGLPSIGFDEGADASKINKAEQEQMRAVLSTTLTGPFAERMANAEHQPVPDISAKDGMGQPIPNAMRPETLFELSKRVWAGVTKPIDDLLALIPKDEREGQQVARSIKRTLGSFFQDLYGTISFLDETNDQYETTREMASNRGGGRSVRRNQGAGAGAFGSGGRGASKEAMNRSRTSSFFQQAQIPITSLDEEYFEAREKRDAFRATLPTYSPDPSALSSQAARDEDTMNMHFRTAGLAQMQEMIPLPNVNLIRDMAKELVDSVSAEIGGTPNRQDVSAAISALPEPTDAMAARARKEALEALQTHDPSNLYSTFGEGIIGAGSSRFGGRPGGYTVLSPATKDSSLPVEEGNALRRGRMRRDGTLVGQLDETPTGAELGVEAPHYFVPGAAEADQRRAELEARDKALRDEMVALPLGGGEALAKETNARQAAITEERKKIAEEMTLVGRPVLTNPVPGEGSTRAVGPAVQKVVDEFHARETARQTAEGGGAAGGGGTGRNVPPGPTGPTQRPSGGSIQKVWIEGPFPLSVTGGGGGDGAPAGGATASGQAAWTRAESQYATSPRMVQHAQRMIDRGRAQKADVSDRALMGMLKESGLGAAAELLLRDEVTAGTGTGGASTINALGRKLGVPRDARMVSSKDREEADQERARLSAEQRVYQERILSRGFTASVTNLIQGRFFADQQEAVNRFGKESSDLAKTRGAVVAAKEDVGYADSVVAEATRRRDAAGPKQRAAAQKQLDNATVERERLDILREARERDAAAQEKKVEQARTGKNAEGEKVGPAVPSAMSSLRNLAIGSVAAAGAFGIGSLVYQAAGQLLGVAEKGIEAELKRVANVMLNFAGTASQVGTQLADATRAAGGNVGAATSDVAYKSGMGISVYDQIGPTLQNRALIEAGNKGLVEQVDLRRAARNFAAGTSGLGQPGGGIPGLTRSTGGLLGSDIGATPDTLTSATRMLPGPENHTWFEGMFPFLTSAQGALNTMFVPPEDRYRDALNTNKPDNRMRRSISPGSPSNEKYAADWLIKSEADFKTTIKGFNDNLTTAGSGLRLFTGATQDQVEAMSIALKATGADANDIKNWVDLGIGISTANGKPLTKEDVEGLKGKTVGTDVLSGIATGAAMPSSEVRLQGMQHAIEVQMAAIQAQSDLSQRARQASFGMEVTAQPPIAPSMQILGVQSPIGPPAPEVGVPSAMNAAIPESVLQSWNNFGSTANDVFAEIQRRAAAGVDQLKKFGLTDAQISQVKAYGDQIKTVQERLIGNETKAFWQDYNRGLELGKRQLGDMLGLLGKQSQEVKGVQEPVMATMLGQQERIVLLKSRELTLLGQELQQRQISFQTSLAGFMSEGLTPEEIAARQDQAKFVAGTSQKQLNLQKDITGASFKIVDEQNLRGFQQSVIDLEKIPRNLEISMDTKWVALAQEQIGALSTDTVNQLGIIVSQFQSVEAAAIQMASTIAAQSAESFAAVFANVQNTISQIAPEYQRMLNAINGGGTYVPSGSGNGRDQTGGTDSPSAGPSSESLGRDAPWTQDTGGPGEPTGSYSGTSFSPTVNIQVASVGSQTDIDDIVRAVERALDRKSSLYGLRTPVG